MLYHVYIVDILLILINCEYAVTIQKKKNNNFFFFLI
jgi:hypothetical protein